MTMHDDLPQVPPPKPFYSLEEVADLLGLHRATVSGFISRGELRAARLGHRTVRITHDALMDFLKSKEVTPPQKKHRGKGARGGETS
jgi:excisionase family DNA binding protein